MKKSLSLALILALCFTYTVGAAETVGTVAGATTTSVAEAASTPVQPPVEQPLTLTAKKLKAETDLKSIHAQFSLFVIRTQATIDRLGTKGVDTNAAQTALTATTTALLEAKTKLDFLSTIVITDDMTDEAVSKTDLKPTLLSIQESLASARTHLIESLTILRSAVSAPTLSQ
jgi:hypothetical protein